MNEFKMTDRADATVERPRSLLGQLGFAGFFVVECLDADGNHKWTAETHNMPVSVGLDYVLNVSFRAQSQLASWYLGLMNTGTLAAGDTMGSHAGWTENTAYAAATRPQWTAAAPSGNAIANSSTVDFAVNGSGTIAGIFVTSDSTKSGTTGTLWATANFTGGSQAVSNGDTLKVTYTITASGT